MGVAKVILNNEVLIDVTGKTVAPSNLLSGETALGRDGENVVGTLVPQVAPKLQSKTVTPSEQTQIVLPDAREVITKWSNYSDFWSNVTGYGHSISVADVQAYEYVRLSGTVSITIGNQTIQYYFQQAVAERTNWGSSGYIYPLSHSGSVTISGDTSLQERITSIRFEKYFDQQRGIFHVVFDEEITSSLAVNHMVLQFSDDPTFQGIGYDGLSQVTVNPIGQWFADQGYIFVSIDETLIYGDWDEAASRITNHDEIPTNCCIIIDGVSMQPTFWIETDNEDLNLPAIRISVDGYSVSWFEDGTLLINTVDNY